MRVRCSVAARRQIPVYLLPSRRCASTSASSVVLGAHTVVGKAPLPPVAAPPVEYDVVVVGGTAAGLAATSRIAKKLRYLRHKRVCLIEPKEVVANKDGWIDIAGSLPKPWRQKLGDLLVVPKILEGYSSTRHFERPIDHHRGSFLATLQRFLPMTGNKGILSRRAEWLKEDVAEFLPDEKALVTSAGQLVSYKYLLLACDYEPDLDAVEGLRDALERSTRVGSEGTVKEEAAERAMVTCNLSRSHAEVASQAVDATKGGKAIFVQPRDKYLGVADTFSMAFLASERWKEQHKQISATVAVGNDEVFLGPKYADGLIDELAKASIASRTDYQLAAVRPEQREADFLTRHPNGGLLSKETRPFDFMFVTPPLKPTAALQGSPLVNSEGFVTVNKSSLRHSKYDSVFAIGDCAAVPAFKGTGAALTQARVATHNILNSPFSWRRINDREEQETREVQIRKGEVDEFYFGYGCNAIHTSKKQLLLAETDYQNDPAETFIIDQGTPSRVIKYLASYWPRMFWKHAVKGKWWAFGPHNVRAVQLADSPWKNIATGHHRSERRG